MKKLIAAATVVLVSVVLAIPMASAQRSATDRAGAKPPSITLTGRWYRANSAWNKRIPGGVPISPRNAAVMQAFMTKWCPRATCLGPTMVGVPAVYFAAASTPLATVEVNYPTCGAREVRVPIPANAIPDGPPEGSMTVMVTKTGVEWDFFKLTRPGVKPLSSGPDCRATDNWAATVAVKAHPGWNGSGTFRQAPRASGTLNGSGLIRPRDTKKPAGAAWDHAIALAYPGTLAGPPVWPAVRNDGRCGDPSMCVPLGARFQLDPAIPCGSWPSLVGEWQRQLCRTLQRYGLIVVDTGSALLAQHPVSLRAYRYPWEPDWRPLPTDLAAHLRVLDWTKWTGRPKGG